MSDSLVVQKCLSDSTHLHNTCFYISDLISICCVWKIYSETHPGISWSSFQTFNYLLSYSGCSFCWFLWKNSSCVLLLCIIKSSFPKTSFHYEFNSALRCLLILIQKRRTLSGFTLYIYVVIWFVRWLLCISLCTPQTRCNHWRKAGICILLTFMS